MLYKTVSLAFAAQAVSGYNMAMPSKIAASRVARAGPVEMAKKSVRTSAQRNHFLLEEEAAQPLAVGHCRSAPDCRHAL